MHISVNKTTNKNPSARAAVTYAALSSGTISHVWYDDESQASSTPKRRNRIRLTHEKASRAARPSSSDGFDA